MANKTLAAQDAAAPPFPEVTEGDACATTDNELLKGNCATDWPTEEMTSYYGVDALEFGDAPGLQDLHGLRNFLNDSTPVSGRYACYLLRARIVNATQRGLQFLQQGDTLSALRWIGHASHTVQDSFTPCHATRTGTRFETLQDICTYGISISGICTHTKPDPEDTVWRLTPLECTFSTTRTWDCLTDNAQAASQATAGYLLAVAALLGTKNYGQTEAAINTWFEGDPSNPQSGYFRCDALHNDGFEPDGWSPPLADAGVNDVSTPEVSTPDVSTPEASQDAPEAEAQAESSEEGMVDSPVMDSLSEETGKVLDATGESAKESAVDVGAADVGAEAQPPTVVETPSSEDSGCSCRTVGSTTTGWPGLLPLALFLPRLRRSRTRSGRTSPA